MLQREPLKKRVVIVGMGFGGLRAARALAGHGLDVNLVDRNNYHLFQPLLYLVATARLEQESIAYPLRALARRWPGVCFRLHLAAKNVELIVADPQCSRSDVIRTRSLDANLIILGFMGDAILHNKEKLFESYDGLGNTLWVNAQNEIDISREKSEYSEETGAVPLV